MSVEVSAWAWKVSGLSPSEKLVLLCLADHSDRDGVSWPSQKTIAEKTLISRKTVNQAIAKFLRLGLLEKEPLGGAYPFNQIYRYKLKCNNPVTSGYNPLLHNVTTPVTSRYTEPSENRHIEPLEERPRSAAFPPNFSITDKIREVAHKNGWESLETELEAFRDYHLARGSVFKDWDRAFYTWLRNAKRFKANGSGDMTESDKEARRQRIAALVAEKIVEKGLK